MSAERIVEIKNEIIGLESKARIDAIQNLQDHMVETLSDDEKIEPPLEHTFAPGAYARTMFLPKGLLIVGKIHKHEHLNIISYGHVKVYTFEGSKEYEGHNVLVSPAGVKRVVHALEDTAWTTIHLTDSTDLEKIEDEIIVKSYDEIDFLDLKKILEVSP